VIGKGIYDGSSAIGDSESTGSGLINPSCGLDTWKIGRILERAEGLRGRRLNQMNYNNISCEGISYHS
jgi:hypothetical protein